MTDTWKISNDLQLTLTEFEKLEYLANNIYEMATPFEGEQTQSEKVSKALMFYAERKNIAVCASLLLDTIDMIRNELKKTAAEAWTPTADNADSKVG